MQTVENQRQGAMTVAKPLDKARPIRTAVECRPSAATATDGPGRCAHSYESGGWGSSTFERVTMRSQHSRRCGLEHVCLTAPDHTLRGITRFPVPSRLRFG